MKKLCMSLLGLLLAGCYTNVSLVLRNGTQGIVHAHGALHVTSSESVIGKEVELAPGKAKKIGGAGHADLFVTTDTGQYLIFTNIQTLDLGPGYVKAGNYMFFGAGYIFGYVMLETNKCLYAVRPGQNAVDPTIPQPAGYPKMGHAANERQ